MSTTTIQSLDDFIKEVLKSPEMALGYRGVTDAQYKLIPGVGRIKEGTSRTEALKNEHIMFFEFKRHIAASHGILSNLSTAILAQHYGLPTRLLDWTASPLTALFFACGNNFSKDSAVYILPLAVTQLRFNEEIYDNILIGENKNLTEKFCKTYSYPMVNKTNFEECLEEYLAFISDPIHEPFIINPYVNNKRIQSQDSFFTLHVNPFGEIRKETINKIIIPASQKANIIRDLTLLGTHEYSIFPDEDGLCKWLKRKHYSDIME